MGNCGSDESFNHIAFLQDEIRRIVESSEIPETYEKITELLRYVEDLLIRKCKDYSLFRCKKLETAKKNFILQSEFNKLVGSIVPDFIVKRYTFQTGQIRYDWAIKDFTINNEYIKTMEINNSIQYPYLYLQIGGPKVYPEFLLQLVDAIENYNSTAKTNKFGENLEIKCTELEYLLFSELPILLTAHSYDGISDKL